jgi:Flp pilus assembly protein TadB
MDTFLIIGLVGLFALGIGALAYTFLKGENSSSVAPASNAAIASNLRALVAAQRNQEKLGQEHSKRDIMRDNLALAAAAETQVSRKKLASSTTVTLEKELRYAQWPITPIQFRIIQVFVTILVFLPCYLHLASSLWILAIFLTPIMVKGVLTKYVNKRFIAFDSDYPVLLMSYVSLLKTGMSTLTGLEAAAHGMEEGSLVRAEVELLIERLRLGLTEDQAIGAFGEDIPHPELELFVQSLLLSRKVGGTLSNTLERLSKQVRKRQQFRQQAVAAVSMERGSVYAVAAIMSVLLGYLIYASPDLILPALSNPLGSKIFQGGIATIISGFYLSRIVSNIKV